MLNANLTYELLGPVIFVAAGCAFLLLYLHDRKQMPALILSGAYFFSLIGFVTVMVVDTDLYATYQVIILVSLLVGHFLLIWGVASLFGKEVPRLAYGLAVVLVASVLAYANVTGSVFWLRLAAISGFTVSVDLICCLLVWRARSHRVDTVVAAVFLAQALVTFNRIARIFFSDIDLSTHSAFKSSLLAPSMQTENAIFAIVIGLALFARYSVTLVMQLKRLAETDPLTGLLNRRAFETKVQALRAASAPLPTGLIICDIDHFKRVNDSHGHDVGDRTLKAFAELLEQETPDTALCTRLGGEEFCIVLAGVNEEAIRLQAAHLRGSVERLQIAIRDGNLRMTASFGYCKLEPGDDLRIAMVQADAAVYQAKNDGRNLVREAAPVSAGPDDTILPDQARRAV